MKSASLEYKFSQICELRNHFTKRQGMSRLIVEKDLRANTKSVTPKKTVNNRKYL